jgi:transcriptional regulator with XRE-family HTH domain
MKNESIYLKKIGSNLRKFRVAKKIKQEYVANKVHLSKSEVSRIENGRRDPGLVKIIEMANVIGMTVTDLVAE